MLKYVIGSKPLRPTLLASLLAASLLLLAGAASAANEGTITSLSATDAPAFDQTITVSATFLANERINNTNAYYEIIAPDGVTVVGTRSTPMPAMDAGDTYADSWTITNSSFQSSGTYTLRACWSPGSSLNCTIDSRAWVSTTFFSVPTLGPELALAGTLVLVWWLWRSRVNFERPAAAAQPGDAARRERETG